LIEAAGHVLTFSENVALALEVKQESPSRERRAFDATLSYLVTDWKSKSEIGGSMVRWFTGLLTIFVLGCGGPAKMQMAAVPAGYPSAEDAAVFRAALDALFGGQPKFVVLIDSTTLSPTNSGNPRDSWLKRARTRKIALDREAVDDFISANRTRTAISPKFGYRLPVRLMTDSLRKLFEARGKILVDAAVRNHSPGVYIIPFWTGFYDAFPGAPGYGQLSKPGFNRDHTRALIEFGQGCGSLCGEWGFMTLEKEPAGWVVTDKVIELVS
jgi:hypothetical protein